MADKFITLNNLSAFKTEIDKQGYVKKSDSATDSDIDALFATSSIEQATTDDIDALFT